MLTTINGKELWLETTGEGPRVVRVSWPRWDKHVLRRRVNALASGNQVTAFDLEGHGRAPSAGTSPFQAGPEDLGAVLDHLGASSASM
ncbi:MAG: hypothetical protein CM1200mP26_00300 [Acidimicrobiales bacterium]|nr:MAG: hypothetical protein CM1200mP26_00300 [Acidimicrobiales bacterium]